MINLLILFLFLQQIPCKEKTPRSHGSEKRPACSTRSQLELEMDADKGKQRQYSQRMAEPRFNNPYFWPPPPPCPASWTTWS
ncbi:unnamed protein product [Bubo scandiacus]